MFSERQLAVYLCAQEKSLYARHSFELCSAKTHWKLSIKTEWYCVSIQPRDWMMFVYLGRFLQSESTSTFPYKNITLCITRFFATATVFATAAVNSVILWMWYLELERIQVLIKIDIVLHLTYKPNRFYTGVCRIFK